MQTDVGPCRHQQDHIDATLEGLIQAIHDFRHIHILVLYIDRAARRIDRCAILIEVRSLTRGNIEPYSFRSSVTIEIAPPMYGSLYLRKRATTLCRNPGRKLQAGFTPDSPTTVLLQPLACFVPALDEIMVNVNYRGAHELDIDVVIVPLTGMTGRNHRMRIEIDSPHECDFIVCAGVDQPAFLVLTETWMSAVPTDFHPRPAHIEQAKVTFRAPERVAFERIGLHPRSPKNNSHIDAAGGSAIKNVQCASPAVWHLEGGPHESHCCPDALSRSLNRIADAPKRRFAVNQRQYPISMARRVRS